MAADPPGDFVPRSCVGKPADCFADILKSGICKGQIEQLLTRGLERCDVGDAGSPWRCDTALDNHAGGVVPVGEVRLSEAAEVGLLDRCVVHDQQRVVDR